MFTAVSTFTRSGAFALGVLLGVSGGAISAPLGPLQKPQAAPAGPALPLHQVVEGEFRDGTNPLWLRRGGGERRTARDGGEWRRGDGDWRRGDDGWRRRGEWGRGDDERRRGDHDWRRQGEWRRGEWRRYGRWNGRHWRGGRWYDNDVGVGITLGLPLWGGYDPGYYPGTYDPYYAPPAYYAPRRVHRAPAGNAHVRWCYARYRSYRAWDNTFQPYVGPRRQCFSPYS